MNYGYFDNKNKEYVITNPMTPSPWMNYIGNGGFGGIISGTGGGITFDSDPSFRRVTRYKYNNQPIDRPGRWLYIRDEETGEYWSATWQPVMKEKQKYECRHGLGYTTITGEYAGIASSVTYCVPLGKRYELWQGKLTNKSNRPRKLKVYSYVEFSWNDAKYDMLCCWPRLAFKAAYDGKKILVDTVAEQLTGTPQYDYIATDLPVCGYDCDLSKFIGMYREESKPIVLETGVCTNSNIDSNNCVGVLCSKITLAPNAEIDFRYTLGATDDKDEVDGQIADALTIKNPVKDIKEHWRTHCEAQVVDTPNANMNTMLNIWHAYQAKTTFDWSRFVSYYERGVDRGFGFRDSMQDVLGIMHAEPELAKERIKLLLSIQCQNGNARSVYYPATKLSVGGGRSDDHLWSIFSVCNYVKETGNIEFLFEDVAYVDGGSDSVLGHLEQGIEFTMSHLGKHGIPDMLVSDWDDSLAPMNQGGTAGAESVFVFFQLGHAAYELIELYKFLLSQSDLEIKLIAELKARQIRMQEVYDYCKSKMDVIWDGEWYIRAFTPSGEKFCTNEDEYNKIHLIPQAWSVLSRLADKEQANLAMDKALEYLYTDFGLITHYKASAGFDPENKSYFLFPTGAGENGGIFYHSNTWPIIALTMLGRGDDAFNCYESIQPIRRNDMADVCLTEPYVFCSSMIAPPHQRAGVCSNSWLTGTASWAYLAATQYILGIRPEYEGLMIDPQIPSDWKEYKVVRKCRGKVYHITVKQGNVDVDDIEKGLYVNGKRVQGNVVDWNYSNESELKVLYVK